MTSQKELFKLFRNITGKTTHSMNNGTEAKLQPWQESRIREYSFVDYTEPRDM